MDALSLMMSQADEVYSGIAGQPKPRQAEDIKCEESLKLLREDLEKLQGKESNVETSNVTDNSVHRNNIVTNINSAPDHVELEEAFTQYFEIMDEGFESVVRTVKTETKPLDNMMNTLSDWFEWTKKRAFFEDNAYKDTTVGSSTTTALDSGFNGTDSGPGLDLDLDRRDRENKRRRGPDKQKRRRRKSRGNTGEGTDKPRSRSNSRTRPRPDTRSRRPSSGPKLRGKAAIAGAVVTGVGLLGGLLLGHYQKKSADVLTADNDIEGSTSVAATKTSERPEAPQPAQVDTVVSRRTLDPNNAEDAALIAEHNRDMAEHRAVMDQFDKTPDGTRVVSRTNTEENNQKLDNIDNASMAMMSGGMLASAGRLPGIGTALQVGSGAMDIYGISQDDSLNKSEKAGEMAGAATSTAATATGALVGGAIGTALIPIPVVGTVIGSLAGSFLGSLAGDKLSDNVSEYVSTKIVTETEEAVEEAEKAREKARKEDELAKLTEQQIQPSGGVAGMFANLFGFGSGPSTGPSRMSMSSNPSGGNFSQYKSNAKLSKGGDYESNLSALKKGMADAGITDPTEMAVFLGQMDHESGGMKSLEENLNYSPKQFLKTFGRRAGITTEQEAAHIISQGKEAQGEAMYGGAWGKKNLGNTEKGDGAKFKGRGFTQLTGRANYARAGKALGIDLVANPELASDPDVAAKIATWYWQDRKGLAEAGKSGDVLAATKKINGGTNGLADRRAKTALYAEEIQSGRFTLEPSAPSDVQLAETGTPDKAPSELSEVHTEIAKTESVAKSIELVERPEGAVARNTLAKADPQSTVPQMLQAPAKEEPKPKAPKISQTIAQQQPSSMQQSNGAQVPSLDGIPVLIDDPIMGMLNIGYI